MDINQRKEVSFAKRKNPLETYEELFEKAKKEIKEKHNEEFDWKNKEHLHHLFYEFVGDKIRLLGALTIISLFGLFFSFYFNSTIAILLVLSILCFWGYVVYSEQKAEDFIFYGLCVMQN